MTTVTVGWLIEQLQAIAKAHGDECPVYLHDADTDWPMEVHEETAVRHGKNEHGEGVEGAVMIQGAGYGFTAERLS